MGTDALNSRAQGEAGYIRGFLESVVTDSHNAIGDDHVSQLAGRAAAERSISDALDICPEGEARQVGGFLEGVIADGHDAVGDDHVGQLACAAECRASDTSDIRA